MSGAPLWLRRGLGAASRAAPSKTARLAFEAFRRPSVARRLDRGQRLKLSEAEALLTDAEHIHVETPEGRIHALRFAPPPGAPEALLLHAWTADARAMAAFVAPLRAAGFGVTIPDLPAHGGSFGSGTDAPASARAVRALLDQLAIRPEFWLTHSFGGGVAGMLAAAGLAPRRFACIASPSRLRYITDAFIDAFALAPRAAAAFEGEVERAAGCEIDAVDGLRIWPGQPTEILLLHAPGDEEIEFSEAERLATMPNARLHPLPGLGHRDVLWRPECIEPAIGFLTGARLSA